MTSTADLSPEALAILQDLAARPKPLPDTSALRELLALRWVMGSPAMVHITSSGKAKLLFCQGKS